MSPYLLNQIQRSMLFNRPQAVLSVLFNKYIIYVYPLPVPHVYGLENSVTDIFGFDKNIESRD